MIIGAQLYTVRSSCKDLDSFAETLARVADMGYTAVQVSGTCAYEPQWLKEQLGKNGLTCVLTHNPPEKLQNETVALAQFHDAFGCRHIGLGAYKFNENDPQQSYDYFFQTYIPVAENLAKHGKLFMYHNHAHEFQKVDGKLILEHIADRLSAAICGFTLDTYWVQAGGSDPAEMLERLSGRVPIIHIKDYAYGDPGDGKIRAKMAVVGEGNLNFNRIFQAAEKAGTEYMLVEQDDCYGEDPFDCLKRSYAYLKSQGFR